MFKHFTCNIIESELHIERNKMPDALAQSIKIMFVFSFKRQKNEVFCSVCMYNIRYEFGSFD